MQEVTFRCGVKEIPAVAAAIKNMLAPGSIVTFAGLLGAGKTTLIQELGRALGISCHMPSPTYGYVNHYAAPACIVHHFDLYRIESVEDFEALGFAAIVADTKVFSFIEWAERIEQLLVLPEYAPRCVRVEIEYCPQDHRMRMIRVSGGQ